MRQVDVFALVAILSLELRIQLLGEHVDNIARAPGAAPADRQVVTEHYHRVAEWRVADHIDAGAMHANRVDIGRAEPAKLRAVDENRTAVDQFLSPQNVAIAEACGYGWIEIFLRERHS